MADPNELEAHLFICTNQREKGECCASKGSVELRDRVKSECKKRLSSAEGDRARRVRINASGCLGHCEDGIVAVLYPQGKWITGLKADEVDRLCDLVCDSVNPNP